MKKVLFHTVLCALLFFSKTAFPQFLAPNYGTTMKGMPFLKLEVDHQGFTYVFSSFDHYEGRSYGRLLKLDANGKPVEGFAELYMDRPILKLVVQEDNKIIIGGAFTTLNGSAVKPLIRLNEDGTVDNTFQCAIDEVTSFDLQSDGKLVAITDSYFVRLNADGTLDGSFSFGNYVPSYSPIAIGPNDEIYYVSYSILFKVLKDGADDNTFLSGTGTTDGSISSIDVQDDGKILLGGYFTTYNGFTSNSIVRVNTDGTVDEGFNVGVGPTGQIHKLLVRENNNIIIGGQFWSYNNETGSLIELNPDGSLHKNIAYVTINDITSITETPDSKIVIGGTFTSVNYQHVYHIARFTADHILDATFLPQVSYANPNSMRISAGQGGAVAISGGYDCFGMFSNEKLVEGRIFSVDRFGAYKKLIENPANPAFGFEHIFQDDGKLIVIEAAYEEKAIRRFNADGSEDNSLTVPNTFTNNGSPISPLCVYQNGDLLLVGGQFESYDNQPASHALIALNLDGSFNRGFDLPSGTHVTSIQKQSNGKLILCGVFNIDGTTKTLIRLNVDGTIDTSFAVAATGINIVSIDENDRIYFIGYAEFDGIGYWVGRLDQDGVFDNTFAASLRFELGPNLHSVQPLPGGNVAIGGFFDTFNGERVSGLVIVDETGNKIDAFDFGYSSCAIRLQYVDSALYAVGRFVNPDYKSVRSLVKINFAEVTVPATPGNVQVELHSAGQFDVTWTDESDNEFAFVIERASESDFIEIDTIDSNTTLFTDPGREANTKYSYRLRAVNDVGFSPYSNVADFTWIPAPEGTIALALENTADREWTLTWVANVLYHDGFLIERAVSSSNDFMVISTVEKNVTAFVDQLVEDGAYDYRVTAYSNGGQLSSNIRSILVTAAESDLHDAISIYPIPASDKLYLQSKQSLSGQWRIISTQGKQMEVSKTESNGISIVDLRDTPPGIYILQFARDGKIITKKFVRQ
jgi:uncharacterized delta-60 repeat protein